MDQENSIIERYRYAPVELTNWHEAVYSRFESRLAEVGIEADRGSFAFDLDDRWRYATFGGRVNNWEAFLRFAGFSITPIGCKYLQENASLKWKGGERLAGSLSLLADSLDLDAPLPRNEDADVFLEVYDCDDEDDPDEARRHIDLKFLAFHGYSQGDPADPRNILLLQDLWFDNSVLREKAAEAIKHLYDELLGWLEEELERITSDEVVLEFIQANEMEE